MKARMLIQLCVLVIFLGTSECNQYDPRPFPKNGPFFEGWYIRIIDLDQKNTFGFLFGGVLPKNNPDVLHPSVIGSVLYRDGCTCDLGVCSCNLNKRDAIFSNDNLNITVHGQPVAKNPNDKSPANFKWVAESDNSKVMLEQNEKTYFDFKQNDLTLTVRIGEGVPWGPNGEGPEGWIMNLPIPLHWFVFSPHAPVEFYELKIGNIVIASGHNAKAHLEKNWGNSFPKAWMWAQGTGADGVIFVIAGGEAPIVPGLFDIKSYLAGYRNPSKNIILNFRPYNSIVSSSFDGCTGSANFTMNGLTHYVEILISSSMDTYSDCLLAPTSTGFRPFCVETYDAVAEISVWKRQFLPPFKTVVDKQTIGMAALEFGGTYVCNEKCG